jgi:hypothetical protein
LARSAFLKEDDDEMTATKKKPSAQVGPARKAAKLKAETRAKTKPDRPTSDRPPRPESDAPRSTPVSESPRGPRGPPSPDERRHHLDKRAAAIAAEPGDDDELLTVVECASWLGVSVQFLDIGRSRGYGPPFARLSRNIVRYRRAEVRAWLIERTHASTSEYRR